MAQNLEDILAELCSKESELALAGRYGNALLEEKEQLRKELQTAREEMKQLEEELQQQRHESQKALIQAKTNTDVLVMDLECKLRSASNNLEAEQNAHRVTKEEQQKELDVLQVDNAKLHAKIQTLLGEKDNHDERVRKVSESLKQSEALGHDASLQHTELLKQLERLELSNKSYSEERSTLVFTCDQLTEELKATRTLYDTLEGQYKQLQDEFLQMRQEMEDSQEMVKQLEAERQRVTASSPTSTMSLHEELSISMNSLDMIPEDTTWQPRQGSESPQGEEEIDSPPGYREGTISQISIHLRESCQSKASTIRRASELSLESGLSTLRRTDHQEAVAAWASSSDEGGFSPCPRCTDLQKMLTHYQKELSSVNKQLLGAISQKIKLQEQNEAWQSDMADVVHQNLHQRLWEDSLTSRQSGGKSPRRKLLSSSKQQDIDKIFKHEFIKHSWLF